MERNCSSLASVFTVQYGCQYDILSTANSQKTSQYHVPRNG